MFIINHVKFEVINYGEYGVRLIPEKQKFSLPSLGEEIISKNIKNIVDVVSSEHEILLLLKDKNNLNDTLKEINAIQIVQSKLNHYSLPVHFNLDEAIKLNPNISIDALTSKTYSIAMFGFLPGFIYFSGLQVKCNIPRKETPQLLCPKGSIAIGGQYLGVYNIPSPAGWNIIGQTSVDISISTIDRLQISDTFSLLPLSKNEHLHLLHDAPSLIEFNE